MEDFLDQFTAALTTAKLRVLADRSAAILHEQTETQALRFHLERRGLFRLERAATLTATTAYPGSASTSVPEDSWAEQRLQHPPVPPAAIMSPYSPPSRSTWPTPPDPPAPAPDHIFGPESSGAVKSIIHVSWPILSFNAIACMVYRCLLIHATSIWYVLLFSLVSIFSFFRLAVKFFILSQCTSSEYLSSWYIIVHKYIYFRASFIFSLSANSIILELNASRFLRG